MTNYEKLLNSYNEAVNEFIQKKGKNTCGNMKAILIKNRMDNMTLAEASKTAQ